jgi:hypothetical protein
MLRGHLEAFGKHIEAGEAGDAEKRQSLVEAMSQLGDAGDLYEQDRSSLVTGIETFQQSVSTNFLATNNQQHTARQAFDPIAEKIKGLTTQVDLLYKLASRATELAGGLASEILSPSSKGMKQAAISSSPPQKETTFSCPLSSGETALLFPLPGGRGSG